MSDIAKWFLGGAAAHIVLETIAKAQDFFDQQRRALEDAENFADASVDVDDDRPLAWKSAKFNINLNKIHRRSITTLNTEISAGLRDLRERGAERGIDVDSLMPRCVNGDIGGTPKLLVYCMRVIHEAISKLPPMSVLSQELVSDAVAILMKSMEISEVAAKTKVSQIIIEHPDVRTTEDILIHAYKSSI